MTGPAAGLRAGAAYFGLVFAAGFVLGTLRVTLLAPALGEIGAVAVEIPVMLGLSWLAAGWLIGRLGVPRGLPRAAMGACAFVLLMAAEIALGLALFDRDIAGILAAWATLPGALGLAGQVVFGLIPLVR